MQILFHRYPLLKVGVNIYIFTNAFLTRKANIKLNAHLNTTRKLATLTVATFQAVQNATVAVSTSSDGVIPVACATV